MPFGIGVWELLILLLAVLLIFGPKRLPDMGRQLGRGMREFKDSVSGLTGSDDVAEATTPIGPNTSALSADPKIASPPSREVPEIVSDSRD